MSDIVLWFHEVDRNSIDVAGGKGANLGELTRAGIAVPPGFVVSADVYRGFLEMHGLRVEIERHLLGLDHNERDALARASDAIQQLIDGAVMPDEIAEAIRAAYEQLDATLVAVRSSATAEDLPTASFAGQQRTLLNISGADAVVDAVKACWASLFETQAIHYRAQGGFDHLLCAIAVPVQKMVQSERSGVMFTVNPVTNDRGQMIIEAAFGLGEAVVSGMVTPDTYIVDKATQAVLDCSVSEQEQELVLGDGGGGETNVWRDIEPARRAQQKLSDGEIAALAELGLHVEAHYGSPQDIEWAIERGEMYILQARPVTTL
jgi:pyruvate,water dikinase